MMDFHYENYERFYAKAKDSLGRGQVKRAAEYLLLAAEQIFKSVESMSPGPLKEARTKTGDKLIKWSGKLTEMVVDGTSQVDVEKKSGIPATPRESEGPKEDGAHSWLLKERLDVRLADVAGLEEAKEFIMSKVIYPLRYPEEAKRYKKETGGGILLYGPAGTGKTFFAKAIAGELEAPLFSVRGSDIFSKWLGESEKNVKKLFEQIEGENTLSVLFFDEGDGLLRKRGKSTYSDRVGNELLSFLDGLQALKNPLLKIATTNAPWNIDEAFLRYPRFEQTVYVGLPNEEARRHILDKNLEGIPLSSEVGPGDIARRTEGYSGADLKFFCQKVTNSAFQRAIEKKGRGEQQWDEEVTLEDVAATLQAITPSVTTEVLARFDEFQRSLKGSEQKDKSS